MVESKHYWAAILAVALATGGCMSTTEPGVSSDGLLVDDGTLESLDGEDWADAEAGCEGMLDESVHFAIASAEFGLVAAVEADGDVVCIDTVEAVEDELEDVGLDDAARRLASAFHAAIRERQQGGYMGGARAGDPDPEPNLDFRRFQFAGDPDPEPNTNL